MQIDRVKNYNIQVNLETGKITYSSSKDDTKILFFNTESNIKIEGTSYFDFHTSKTSGHEIYIPSLHSLELNVSQTCNMKCTYCFANGGTYGNPGMMSFDTAKKAIDLLYNSSNNNNISIIFFGGEPFLNFKLIREVVEYIKNRYNCYDTSYHIATNGTILTEEILEFIKNHNFFIQVSLDGEKLYHDKYRVFLDGTPTYEIIISNIKKMKKYGINLQIRATLCHQNTKIKNSVLFYVKELNSQVNFLPVTTKDKNILLDQDDLNSIYIEYLEILEDAIASNEYKRVLFTVILRDMILHCFNSENLILLAPRTYFCGAGLRMLSVDISGNIYPCHGFIGNNQFNFGNVNTNIDIYKLKQFSYYTHISNKKECLNCIARNICGGGCRYYFYEVNDDLNLVHEGFCGFIKTLYKLAILIYVNLKEKGISKELLKSPLYIEIYDILLNS